MFRVEYKGEEIRYTELSYQRDLFNMLDILTIRTPFSFVDFLVNSKTARLKLISPAGRLAGIFSVSKYKLDGRPAAYEAKIVCRNAKTSDMLDSNLVIRDDDGDIIRTGPDGKPLIDTGTRNFLGVTVEQAVTRLGQNFRVGLSSDANTVRNAKNNTINMTIKATEKIGAFLNRIAEKTGLFISTDNFGNIIVINPSEFVRDDINPTVRISDGDILGFEVAVDYSKSYDFIIYNESNTGGAIGEGIGESNNTYSLNESDPNRFFVADKYAAVADRAVASENKTTRRNKSLSVNNRTKFISIPDIANKEEAEAVLAWHRANAKAQELKVIIKIPASSEKSYRLGYIYRLVFDRRFVSDMVLHSINYNFQEGTPEKVLSFVDATAFARRPKSIDNSDGIFSAGPQIEEVNPQ